MNKPERPIRTIVSNRRATHEYEILHRYEAGIELFGTEVKSIRAGKVNINDAYAVFPSRTSNDLFIIGMHINPYDFGSTENHEPLRKRRLLLKTQELKKLRIQLEEKGLTIVPLALYFSGPYIKLELGVGRGKKYYDKRASIKERELKKEAKRIQS